jgi:hypothetical protein
MTLLCVRHRSPLLAGEKTYYVDYSPRTMVWLLPRLDQCLGMSYNGDAMPLA